MTQDTSEKLSPEARSTIKIVFLTLFLDMIGFSIIFPLFPSLIDHYLKVDPNNFFLTGILGLAHSIMSFGGASSSISPVVLFGGILGAVYSFLQFVAAPFWGSLSDRIGRRRILIISISGIILSYIIWFLSGSFTVLIIARIIGGIMGGNISTATAAVGDVTSEKTRSRGMAFVGIAIGTGFIFGPALGGITSTLRLDQIYPDLVVYGVNPFSAPALLACLIATINLIIVVRSFRETLPAERRGQSHTERTANIFALFRPMPNAGVNLTNFANFFFISTFSGMEFTLTFLAVERLQFTSMDNGLMFIYVGMLIALVQGGYVRRKAHSVGEKRMALMGLFTVIPGLVTLSLAHSNMILHVGLTFLAVGSAMIIPCFTSLVSLFASAQEQGRAIGTFRSLGALARVVGPFFASIIYWRFGSATAYLVGACMLSIPILFALKIPERKNAS